MTDLADVRRLAAAESGLAVVALARADGTVHASVVNAGVLEHPVTGAPVVGFVTRGGSYKLRRLREQPRVTLTFRAGWQWASVEGDADLAGPDDHLDGVADLPGLLRDVFRAAGGSHEDWATYDRVMAGERRAAVLVSPERIYA